MNKTIALVSTSVLCLVLNQGQAAMLQVNDVLMIGEGSWFSLSSGGSSSIFQSDQVAVFPAIDGGVLIGSTQSPGEIDSWAFNNADGNHFTTIAPTGGTDTGINFTGWDIFWNGAPQNGIDQGVWAPNNCLELGCDGVTFTDDVAAFNWSGVYGDTYDLWFGRSLSSCPTCFDSLGYFVHLTGTVQTVPIPATVWLFGSGLIGLIGFSNITRRGINRS